MHIVKLISSHFSKLFPRKLGSGDPLFPRTMSSSHTRHKLSKKSLGCGFPVSSQCHFTISCLHHLKSASGSLIFLCFSEFSKSLVLSCALEIPLLIHSLRGQGFTFLNCCIGLWIFHFLLVFCLCFSFSFSCSAFSAC